MRLEHSCEEEITIGLDLYSFAVHFIVRIRISNLTKIPCQILSFHIHLITENGPTEDILRLYNTVDLCPSI